MINGRGKATSPDEFLEFFSYSLSPFPIRRHFTLTNFLLGADVKGGGRGRGSIKMLSLPLSPPKKAHVLL